MSIAAKRNVEGEAADKVDPSRKAPVIPAGSVVVSLDGFFNRFIGVRLPPGFTAADLGGDPEAWAAVQRGRSALRKFDKLTLIAADESWLAEAFVAHADAERVVLARPSIVTLPERYAKLLEDDKYRTLWTGTGYAIQRRADGHMMTDPVASLAVCERQFRDLYPRAVQ